MKKYKLSYIAAIFFVACFLTTVRYFDGKGDWVLIIAGLVAMTATIINFKLDQ